MTNQTTVPTSASVEAFLVSLRKQRDRLISLTHSGPAGTEQDEIGAAIDEIGEHLLVADEELRVQTEHLDASTHRLDRLIAAYEELFADAPVAYIQTDADGLIIRMNRAAVRLLAIELAEKRKRTLAGLVRAADRGPLRQLLSELRLLPAGPTRGPAGELEVILERPGAAPRPVVLTVRATSDGETGAPIFHWELREQAPAAVPAPPPRPGEGAQAPVFQLIADAAADLARQDGPPAMLERIAAQARRAVAKCDEVGITVVRARQRVETLAATSNLAAALDHLEYELGEGPCLHAIDDSTPVLVDDVGTDRRWPRFGPRAAALGVGSILAAPLVAPRGVLGALNFYAVAPDAFDADDELVAQAFATHAGIALAHAELEANLRIGLSTREEIGRAVGILMERHRVRAGEAFDLLVVASQRTNRKIRDIAAWMNETGEDPTQLPATNGMSLS